MTQSMQLETPLYTATVILSRITLTSALCLDKAFIAGHEIESNFELLELAELLETKLNQPVHLF